MSLSSEPAGHSRRDLRPSRRIVIRQAGGAAILAVLGAARPASTAWTMPAGNVTVAFWDSSSALKTRLYNERILPGYAKRRPGYTIKYESIATGQLLQKLLVSTAAGTAPDLFEVGDWTLPTYFRRGLLDPLPAEAFGARSQPEFLETYLPGSLAAMTHEGRLYGLPDFSASHSLHINNRLFREAGLDPVNDAPRTWVDVARLNRILVKRKGDQVVQKGFEFRYVDDRSMSLTFHHLLYQAGGEVLDAEGRPAFNSDAGVRAMEVWKSVTVAPRVSHNTGASPFQDFGSEQDAMSYIGPNGQAQSVSINPRMKDNVTVAPLPQINPAKPATMAFSFVVVVNAKVPDERKQVAWDFIAYALSEPRLWIANGALLPQKSWATSEEAKRLLPFYDVFMHDLAIGRPLARTPHFAELQAALARMIERVVLNGADPKPALDQAAAEFTRAVKA